MNQLDRIEQKLDRLLSLMGGTGHKNDLEVKAAIFAEGGVEALRAHCKAESKRKAQGGKA